MIEKQKHNYPQHLFEPIRIHIAKDYLKQDYRKTMPGVKGQKIWQKIDKDIDSWFESTSPVGGVRDFWNRFDGVAMGGKLKVGLLQILTAENVYWELVEKLPLDEHIASGGGLGYIDRALDKRRLRASELSDFMTKPEHVVIAKHWQQTFAQEAGTSESRDQFPIIVMEEVENEESILSVYDGNRRFAQAVLNGKKTILAYVGRYLSASEKVPQNYWLPTSFLMVLVKETELLGTDDAYSLTLGLLKGYQSVSESGRYELLERILIGNSPVRQRLKMGLLHTEK